MTAPPGCGKLIDVSAAQGTNIDWAAVAASGVAAVYVEHGVGNDGRNACVEAQVSGARAAGLLVGRYDFAYPIGFAGAGRDARSQAALHAAVDLGPYDLPSVLDLEWPDPAQWARWGCSSNQIVQWVLTYSFARPDVTRLYTMPAFVEALGSPPELARFDLWLAEWTGAGEPSTPDPWPTWAAWQYAAGGTVQGCPAPVDLSWIRLPPDQVPTIPDALEG